MSKYRIIEKLTDSYAYEILEWDTWEIVRENGDDDIVPMCLCYDKENAYLILSALRWQEELNSGTFPASKPVVIPKSKSTLKPKPKPKKLPKG